MTITPTELVSEAYETRCVRMLEEMPEIDDLEGRIVVDDRNDGIYIYDFSTDTQVMLDALFDTIVVSPDHSRVVYLDNSARRFFVSTIDGNVIKSFWTDPLNLDQGQDLFPVQWLDTQHILMFAPATRWQSDVYAPYAAIFDLEAGRSEKIAMDFPGINLNYNLEGSKWFFEGFYSQDSRLVISPDQEYFLYPAQEGSTSYLIIWDRDSGEEVSRFPGIMPQHTEPRWSPVEDQFSVISLGPDVVRWYESEEYSGDEIFLFDNNGNYEQITSFGTDSPGHIVFSSWSQDGKQIAFWFYPYDVADWDPFGGTLYVVNLETGIVVDYCLEGRREIYWSLDGNYIT
jgi:hypothetical protein